MAFPITLPELWRWGNWLRRVLLEMFSLNQQYQLAKWESQLIRSDTVELASSSEPLNSLQSFSMPDPVYSIPDPVYPQPVKLNAVSSRF